MATLAAQHPNPLVQIGTVARGQQIPFLQQGRQFGAQLAQTQCPGTHHHVRQPGMNAKRARRLAVLGNGAVGVDQIQPLQQLPGLLPVCLRRRIDPGHLIRGPGAPLRQLKHQRRQVGLLDFRRCVLRQAELLGLAPQPVADPRFHPTGPAPALFRRGPRHPGGHQPGHATVGVEHRPTLQTGIDHHPHAFDGQAGLGNGGRQHHLAPTGLSRGDGPVLFVGPQVAVQRRQHHGLGQPPAQGLLDPANLPGTGQKHQHRAGLRSQRLLDNRDHLILPPALARHRPVLHRHRKRPALAGHHRHIAQHPGNRRGVERRRHHQNPQVVPQRLLGFAHQRQAQVRLQRALVELVEQHRGIVLEHGVVLDQPGQDAFGHHFDLGVRRYPGIQPGPVADGLTRLLAQLPGHVARRRARRQPSRLQHQNLTARPPVRRQQRHRHPGGLTGPRRCLQQHGGVLGQGFGQGGENVVNRQHVCRGMGMDLGYKALGVGQSVSLWLDRVSRWTATVTRVRIGLPFQAVAHRPSVFWRKQPVVRERGAGGLFPPEMDV